MRSNDGKVSLGMIALIVWFVTVGVAALFFIRGSTAPSSDGRSSIVLAPAERDLVLKEMRGMLSSVDGVVAGVANHDLQQVAQAARGSGMAVAADVSPRLMLKLPLKFKRMGMAMHKSFDDLASSAERGAGPDQILARLGNQLSSCAACHAAYRLEASSTARRE